MLDPAPAMGARAAVLGAVAAMVVVGVSMLVGAGGSAVPLPAYLQVGDEVQVR